MDNDKLPKAFDFSKETNAKLAKFKQVREGRWSLRSEKSLRDMAELALSLLALGRLEEVAQIGEFVAQNVSFHGDYDIWGAAADSIFAASRACRILGDEPRRRRLFEPIRVSPPNVINEIATRGAMDVYTDAGGTPTGSSARLVARSHIGDLEDALSGRAGMEWMPIDVLEQQLVDALAGIRHSLEPTKK